MQVPNFLPNTSPLERINGEGVLETYAITRQQVDEINEAHESVRRENLMLRQCLLSVSLDPEQMLEDMREKLMQEGA